MLSMIHLTVPQVVPRPRDIYVEKLLHDSPVQVHPEVSIRSNS